MRPARPGSGHRVEGINVTPIVDVVMCLIVFFLMVGRLSQARLAELQLPASARGDAAHTADPLVINVVPAPGGARIVVEGRDVDAGLLEVLVRERLVAAPSTPIQLRADRALAYGAVEPVVRACRAAGAPSLRLVAERAP